MRTRFLLGPSGSGKTFRCVAEARAALQQSPWGGPLLILAPKQATFQIERQLLGDSGITGYTRLRILSFDRLAELILTECAQTPPQLLSGEGRLMVLRSLLSRHRDELKLFRATARLRGFAQELSLLLRELERAQLAPEQLHLLGSRLGQTDPLGLKLLDLATIWKAYIRWLEDHHLHDEDQLLSLAAETLHRLRSAPRTDEPLPDGFAPARADGKGNGYGNGHGSLARAVRFDAMWFDGFAELARQEMNFLAALLPCCERATLAFNIDRESVGPVSWLSPWSVVGETVRELRDRLSQRGDMDVTVEWLDPDSGCTRFASNPVLKHLERRWCHLPSSGANAALNGSEPGNPASQLERAIRVAVCPNREAEARLAAREILRFVRAGGQYRDAAVIVRNLESYYDPVRRVFSAFEIPFFLDRRVPVGHHPLPELTRSGLRTLAFQWQPEDWFAALKTGLVHRVEGDIDLLENEALARGWKGGNWLQPLAIPDNPELAARLERLRLGLMAPFEELAQALGPRPSGDTLARALAAFWDRLRVAETLQIWSAQPLTEGKADVASLIHLTLWEQMQDWLGNVSLAFGQETFPLREWLPVLEAGLATQTVGVIPPTLDQVLVGAIDRSRNPDLKLALVLGVNESVFPAVPQEPVLLSSADREQLTAAGASLSASPRQQLAQERYLGYVACTRARERLVLTCAARDESDQVLNPSPFFDHVQRLFPGLQVETGAELEEGWTGIEHRCELIGAALHGGPGWGAAAELAEWLETLPKMARLKEQVAAFKNEHADERLTPRLAECLYGPTLETSVSRLEEYAACPFRFAVRSGLRAEERKLFQADARHQGSFQHEVLARFHQQLAAEGKLWRDVRAAEARERVGRIAGELIPAYEGGVLLANAQTRFLAQSLVASLQECVAAMIDWMPQYQFDPHAVELAFGIEEKPLPAWEIDLGEGHRLSFRGKIDRVDLCRDPASGSALCVVIDYKSSLRKLDSVLVEHGIQLQLLAYLNVLRALEKPEGVFQAKALTPAGVFFVNLRGRYGSVKNRVEALDGVQAARGRAYQHTGRFDLSALPKLDCRPGTPAGDQFNYRFRQNGQLNSNCREALDSAGFDEMLHAVESHLQRFGREIYSGIIKVDPYRKSTGTACDRCEYQPICRIDPWTHPFRVL